MGWGVKCLGGRLGGRLAGWEGWVGGGCWVGELREGVGRMGWLGGEDGVGMGWYGVWGWVWL